MLEFNINNGDKLKKKAQLILKLQANQAKNLVKFTAALESLIKNPNLQAVLALCNDEFKFENVYEKSVDGSTIVLGKNYGIKGGKYVAYIPNTGKARASQEEDFDDISDAPQARNVPKIEEKSRAMKANALVQDVMKTTLDIETVYNSWVSQLIAKGNELADAISDAEIEGEEVDDSLFNTESEHDDFDAEDEAIEEV